MSAAARPGSNWSALQQKLRDGSPRPTRTPRRRHTSHSEGRKAEAPAPPPPAAPAKQPLPWFAEDLTPEDLALVLSTSGASDADLKKRDVTREHVEELKRNAIHWEGYLDEATKRRIVLGEDDAEVSPAKKEVGHYVGIDCEMVGVGPGARGSALARVTLVNWHGYVVYDKFVRPQEKVTDYRTWVSGVHASDLQDAPSFATVQQEVADLIKGRVLVGHAIENDLRALMLSHPRPQIRDTAQFQPLRDIAGRKNPGLRALAKLVLGLEIQKGGHAHSPVEDARTTMAIFRTQKDAWDRTLGIQASKKHRKRAAPAAASGLTIDVGAASAADDEEELPKKTTRTATMRSPLGTGTVRSPLGTAISPRTQISHRLSQLQVRREQSRREAPRAKSAPEWWLND